MTEGRKQPELVSLVRELTFELESEIVARFATGNNGSLTDLHPVMKARFDRDMEPVNRARQFLRDQGLDK